MTPIYNQIERLNLANYQPRKNHPPSLQRQRGVVIVVALFIVALVAAMSYLMMARLERDTRRTTLILRHTQAELYAQGSVLWARDVLRQNWENQQAERLIDKMPLTSPAENVNGYHIQSTITDLQGNFNINNLAQTNAQPSFKRLILVLNPNLSDGQAVTLTKAVADWVTPGLKQTTFDQYYLSRPEPYRAPHHAMASVTELRLVKGITPAIYTALLPHISALPAVTPINVQTASIPALLTIDPKMTIDAAKALVALRQQKAFTTAQTFLESDVGKNNHIKSDQITVVSHYFLVETTVSIEQQQLVTYTILQRVAQDNKAKVNVIWQSKGC